MRMLVVMKYIDYVIQDGCREDILNSFVEKVVRPFNGIDLVCCICCIPCESTIQDRQAISLRCHDQHALCFECARSWIWEQFTSNRQNLYEFEGFTCPFCRKFIE